MAIVTGESVTTKNVTTDTLKLASVYVPENPKSPGVKNQIVVSGGFFYYCEDDSDGVKDVWSRVAISKEWEQ